MKSYIFLSLFLFLSSISFSQVVKRDTVIQWQHFDYEMNEYYGLANYSSSNIVTSSFNGIVLENEWVKLCLIPEFGGRIISYIYKPTGKEQLYQNPVGVPYNIGNGIFYHDWLMVYGGIFPTFPDPEHGKYWNVPWKSEVLSETSDLITISMAQKDTLNNPQHPGQYGGVTGITCQFNVSLAANQPYFTVDVVLENDESADYYEYWTCITFSPGSASGNTYTPAASEIIMPIEQYKMGWNPGDWMLGIDEVIQSNGPWILEYKNLAHLSNWEDMGIAYAYPTLEEAHYGVINHENEHGLFRLSSDQTKTPGMKFWTWGNSQGLNADPTDFNTAARPYIELWSGVSREFFEKDYLGANEQVQWTETYLPTVGLSGIDYISKEISHNARLEENELTINTFYPPVNAEIYNVKVLIHTTTETLLDETQEVLVDNEGYFQWAIDMNEFEFSEDKASIEVALIGNEAVLHQKTFEFERNVLSNEITQPFNPELYVSNGAIHVRFESQNYRRLALFNLKGELVSNHQSNSQEAVVAYPGAGIYFIKVVENNRLWTKKIALGR